MTEREINEFKNEIEAVLASDKSLEWRVYFHTDCFGNRWLQVEYRYPGEWIKKEHIGCDYDNSRGYATWLKDDLIADIRHYIHKKGDVAEGVIAEVGGLYPCDRDSSGDGNNPYSKGLTY